ncbi:hypothetical protein SAMN05216525_12971 [Bradyrhizobium sp. Gha]|nr:hypothetical protein SAMN05216525_12971 [Bradyrhizobium sp. Gha]
MAAQSECLAAAINQYKMQSIELSKTLNSGLPWKLSKKGRAGHPIARAGLLK